MLQGFNAEFVYSYGCVNFHHFLHMLVLQCIRIQKLNILKTTKNYRFSGLVLALTFRLAVPTNNIKYRYIYILHVSEVQTIRAVWKTLRILEYPTYEPQAANLYKHRNAFIEREIRNTYDISYVTDVGVIDKNPTSSCRSKNQVFRGTAFEI